MNYNEFCNQIKVTLQSNIGEDYLVDLIPVIKLNGVKLQSIVIRTEKDTMTPNIYLEEYYARFQEGSSIAALVSDILSTYSRHSRMPDFTTELFTDFNTVKDKIFLKVINYEMNQELLKELPHKKYMDLAIIFCVLVSNNKEGIASINIKHSLMTKWGVTIDSLYEHAFRNTPLLFGRSVRMMDDIVRDILLNDCSAEENNSLSTMMDELIPVQNSNTVTNKMYVATNSSGVNGSVWLLYQNEMNELSERLNSSLYILPSSIHELIILAAKDSPSNKQLLEMVNDVNNTQVPPNEILSTNVYFYDQNKRELQSLF